MAYKRYARRRVRRRVGRKLGYKVKRLAKIVNRTKPSRRVYNLRSTPYVGNYGSISAASACAIQLFTPSAGTGFADRLSPVCHLQKLDVCANVLTSNTSDVYRCIIWSMRDVFEPGVDANSFFLIGAGTASAPTGVLQPSSLCNQSYKILYDSGPRPIGTVGGLNAASVFRKTINLKGMKVDFGSGTGGTVQQHPIYMAIWGMQTPGSSPTYITSTIADVRTQVHYTSA